MEENLAQLLQEYKNTKECLESGLKWLPENQYAISKIEVIKKKEYLQLYGPCLPI